MRHERSTDLLQDDTFDAATGRVGGFTISELFEAAAAFQYLRFSHLPASWTYDARCYACGRVKTFDRWRFESTVGSHALVAETGRRLRCTKCGLRGTSMFRFIRTPR